MVVTKKLFSTMSNMLAEIKPKVPILRAGKREVSDDVGNILNSAGKEIIITENLLPNLHDVNVEPSHSAIRGIFMRRIIHAKGIDKARQYVTDIMMPSQEIIEAAFKRIIKGARQKEDLKWRLPAA